MECVFGGRQCVLSPVSLSPIFDELEKNPRAPAGQTQLLLKLQIGEPVLDSSSGRQYVHVSDDSAVSKSSRNRYDGRLAVDGIHCKAPYQ